MISPEVTVCKSLEELAVRATDVVVHAAREAVRQRGRFTLVLAGGSTPQAAYQRLAEPKRAAAVQWLNTFVFFGDERFVPHDDPRSNFRMARRALLDHVPLSADQVFAIPTDRGSAAECAAAYDAALKLFFSDQQGSRADAPPRLDLILLGLGEDGHTVSLFPGAPALQVEDAWATSSPPGRLPPVVDRITMTFPILNAARQVVFLVAGANKAPAVLDAIEGQVSREECPAAGVRPHDGRLAWLVEEAAASLLSRRD